MVGNMVHSVWLAAKGCQSSADRTFVLSQWQDLMNASPRPSPDKINGNDAADRGKGATT